jgi:5'-nucleotidase
VVEKLDPRGRKYYWIAGTPMWQRDSGTDHDAVSSGRVSITPLHLDLTYYRGLEILGALQQKLERLDLRELSEGGPAAPPADAGGE